jgi:hypothetical protein
MTPTHLIEPADFELLSCRSVPKSAKENEMAGACTAWMELR